MRNESGLDPLHQRAVRGLFGMAQVLKELLHFVMLSFKRIEDIGRIHVGIAPENVLATARLAS